MKRQSIINYILASIILLMFLMLAGILYKTEQLQEQVNNLQGEFNTYRTLIFNLYGQNGG
ncbi:hypothetical protein ACVR1I_06475 [Streptococcus cameli]